MSHAADRTFESLTVGEVCVRERHITTEDISLFAELSGDYNPLHTDTAYAATTQFGRPIVHGMFLASLVSELVGMHLPGMRCLLIKEELEFKLPVYAGDTVHTQGAVVSKSEATRILTLSVSITRADDVVIQGTVYVRIL